MFDTLSPSYPEDSQQPVEKKVIPQEDIAPVKSNHQEIEDLINESRALLKKVFPDKYSDQEIENFINQSDVPNTPQQQIQDDSLSANSYAPDLPNPIEPNPYAAETLEQRNKRLIDKTYNSFRDHSKASICEDRFLFPYLEYVVDRDHFSPQDEALLFTVLFNRHFEHPKTVKDIIADPNKIRNIDNYDSFANAIKVDESGCVVYKVGNYKYDLPIMGASEPKSSDDLNKDSAWFSAHEAYSKQVSYAIDATELKAGRKLK